MKREESIQEKASNEATTKIYRNPNFNNGKVGYSKEGKTKETQAQEDTKTSNGILEIKIRLSNIAKFN